ncbi:hypothetical protein ZEAMMB73_Zm00001d040407 [Zea mays]|uniref:Uncharacterized protein n=1 Tax=Zea mays TaxID=4577 RepID=A0A1D6MQJ9_MAIZE|nr:hypothetical protein ZEAMMB73_Zm00001d040407 [Zea mays]
MIIKTESCSAFEAERSGYKFSVQQRIGTYFLKGILYGSVGFFCGLVGQGIANLLNDSQTVQKHLLLGHCKKRRGIGLNCSNEAFF